MFLNMKKAKRSRRAERIGTSALEGLTGQSHPNFLDELLGPPTDIPSARWFCYHKGKEQYDEITYFRNENTCRDILRFFRLLSPCSLFYSLFGTRPCTVLVFRSCHKIIDTSKWRPKKKILIKVPITALWISALLEKQIVLRQSRLMRVLKVRWFRSIFCVFFFPTVSLSIGMLSL